MNIKVIRYRFLKFRRESILVYDNLKMQVQECPAEPIYSCAPLLVGIVNAIEIMV